MRLRLATLLALLALVLTACGQSEKEKYVDDYKPLNDRLLSLGQDLGAAIQGAESKSDEALARQFSSLATRLRGVNKDVAALDTPADLRDEARALRDTLNVTIGDIEDIAKAARGKDAQAAAAATVELAADSEDVNAAQNKLARATGAKVGDR